MNRMYTSLIIAALLASAGMAASAQNQSETPRQSLQVAERLMQERSGLYSAIAIAEAHTEGVAIGVQLSRNLDRYSDSGQGRGTLGSGTGGHTSDLSENERRNLNQTNKSDQHQTRSVSQRSGQSGPLFAIVTCVVDRSKVRDVIVDLDSNTVIGVRSAAYRHSEQHDLQQRSSADRDYSSEYDSSAGAASGFVLASDLMNATVRNTSGENLGDIDELAIDPDSNRIVYGVLRRGGFLGMGESRYAIATSELEDLQHGRIVLPLDEERFENIDGFDNDNWPMKSEPKLNLARTSQDSKNPTPQRVVKASNIIGSDLQCHDGYTFGEITDLVVEPRTGRVLYALVSTDRGQAPVPMGLLQKSGQNYFLPMGEDQLRAMPVVDSNSDQNWGDENRNQRIHKSYGAKYETASARSTR